MPDPTWPVDDEVVEALARRFQVSPHSCRWEALRPLDQEYHRTVARAFLTRHRLVRLPEEPMEWEIEADIGDVFWSPTRGEDDAKRFARMATTATGRIRPVYRIPGQPIHVNQENDDAE